MIRWVECPICHIKHSPTDNDLTSAPIAECPVCRLKCAPTDNDLTSATADTYNFSLVITPPTVDEETAADTLYGGGCDDAMFSASGGVHEVEFNREAPSFRKAVLSAIGDVSKSGIGSRVLRVVRRWTKRWRSSIGRAAAL